MANSSVNLTSCISNFNWVNLDETFHSTVALVDLRTVFSLAVLNCYLALLVFEYFRALITVLVIATVFSFLLDYPVRFLRRYGLKRDRAVLSVLFLTLLVLVVLGLTLAPILLNQITELATRLPTWIVSGTEQIEAFHKWAENRNLRIDVRGLTTQFSDRLSAQLQSLTGEILKFGLGAADSLLNFLLTIVLTFYLLLHGNARVGRIV